MKKIIILSLLLAGCSLFDWRSGYYISYDKGVGCEAYPPIPSDIDLELVDPNIIRLTSAPRAGVYIGIIGAREYKFQEGFYTLSGWFRKAGGQPEQIDVNVQYIVDYKEYHAEIIWSLNPQSPLYQKVWTRNTPNEPIILFEVPDDAEWHYFEIFVYHGLDHYIKSIEFDKNHIDLNLPMGEIEKDYEKWFGILLETQNTYTNCDGEIQTSGISEWKDVSLRYGD